MPEREQCDACRGEGAVMVSEWCDQYGRTHASYDTCPGCGGEGEIEIEPIDQDDPPECPDGRGYCNANAIFAKPCQGQCVAFGPHNPGDDCPEAIAQWATFGEREEGNWFQRLHDSDKAWAERNGGQRERE